MELNSILRGFRLYYMGTACLFDIMCGMSGRQSSGGTDVGVLLALLGK
jgi:hypothetical protein